MPTPDSNLSTLGNIRTKVRRLTRNPSEAQLSTTEIDNYVNNFVLYNMPAQIKLSSLEKVLIFFTHPDVDVYETNNTDTTDPLYNFKNIYTNVLDPVYIAGRQADLYQTREEFYSIYPQISSRVSIGTGDGIVTDFTYTLEAYPILKNSVVVSTINTALVPVVVVDTGEGDFTGAVNPLSSISYSTGQIYVSFTTAPADGEDVWVSYIPYTAGQPNSILFFDDKFVVRPVPDQSYKVEINAYKRPTEFISASPTQVPELSEWWEYIALGASIKILQDRLDGEGVNMLIPMFKEQEILIGRRKIVQNAGKRTPTIYSGVE